MISVRHGSRILTHSSEITPFAEDSTPAVRGFLHRPASPSQDALVLTHGAGSSCQSPLLVAVARGFAEAGFTVLRCDLPYRQKRPHGPPFPADAAPSRHGLRNALLSLRKLAPGDSRFFLGGHSYGGRQATMLAAEDPDVANGLLLLSYPLHPPRQPTQLRTEHFSLLRTRSFFVQGARDSFASLEQMEAALALIPAPTALLPVERAGHDLAPGGKAGQKAGAMRETARQIVSAFRFFFEGDLAAGEGD